jgi:DNA-binding NtrC family response regulator
MEKEFTILIADRNRHVREFLRRELMAEGYKILLAKTGREVLKLVFNDERLDLLILDMDLPDAKEMSVLERVEDRIPTLPVVVHTFLEEYLNHQVRLSTAAFVEKEGTNIDRLKQVVLEVLRKSYPQRFGVQQETA